MRGNKFCPKCGTSNNLNDAYCIKCGYNFGGGIKKRKSKFWLILILLILAWIGIRLYLNKSIIPTEIIDVIQNMTSSKTG